MGKTYHFNVVRLGYRIHDNYLFSNINFTLQATQTLIIEGPNGSGKSSLLRLLAGISRMDEGDIFWQHHSIHNSSAFFKENIHYLGHQNGLKMGLTVHENLHLSHHLHLSPFNKADTDILQTLQLHAHVHQPIHYLSAGQKRRVALARLLFAKKPLWLLDEPLTALDKTTQDFFIQQLITHLQKGGIAVMSSHHPIPLPHLHSQTLRLEPC